MSGPALREEVPEHAGVPEPGLTPRLLTVTDWLLGGTVVLLASWTVVYHVALLARLGSTPALVVEAVVLLAVVVALCAVRGHAATSGPSPDGARPVPDKPVRREVAMPVAIVAAGACAVAMALDAPWVLVWPTWLAAGLAGMVYAARQLVRAPRPPNRPDGTAAEGWLVLGSTIGLAGLATVVLRPNPDDLFYVNWAQWVAEHGEFPLRDTLYSDREYPLANWPPVASYDGLVGALAHLVGAAAGNVAYVVVPPLATALAVLALWRLLRTWRVRHVSVALVVALTFLLLDGTSSYATPGNLFITRMWQGKVVLACVLVPVLLTHLVRHVERPTRARLGWLFLCGAAAVALSTTAIFLVPVLAAAGAAPLVRTSTRTAVATFAATSAYPLGVGIVTVALGGRSADDFGSRRQYRFDPAWFGHEVFLSGPLALVAVLAVLLGALLVPHPAARVTTAAAVLVVGVTFVPGFTHLSYDLVGLGPTLWRLTWGCTVAALVGVGASRLTDRLGARRSTAVAGLAVGLLVAAFASPIWAVDTGTRFAAPPHWQRGESSREAATWLVGQAGTDGRVLAPDELAITVVVTQTDVKVVVARDYYLDYLRDDPTFHYQERLALAQFANGDPVTPEVDIPGALALLDVRAACLYADDDIGARILREAGYHRGYLSSTFRCFSR